MMRAEALSGALPEKMNQRIEIGGAVRSEAPIVDDVKKRMRIDPIWDTEKHVMAVGIETQRFQANLLSIEAAFEKRREIYIGIWCR